MDFALDAPDPAFRLSPYLDRICRELKAYGYDLEIDDRSKVGAAVQQGFVKDDSIGKLLRLEYRPRTGPMGKLRVELEVDTKPLFAKLHAFTDRCRSLEPRGRPGTLSGPALTDEQSSGMKLRCRDPLWAIIDSNARNLRGGRSAHPEKKLPVYFTFQRKLGKLINPRLPLRPSIAWHLFLFPK